MTAVEIKKHLVNRIVEINDVPFLMAIKTILDSKTGDQTIHLTAKQLYEIIESKKETDQGIFIAQEELDKDFDKWLGER